MGSWPDGGVVTYCLPTLSGVQSYPCDPIIFPTVFSSPFFLSFFLVFIRLRPKVDEQAVSEVEAEFRAHFLAIRARPFRASVTNH